MEPQVWSSELAIYSDNYKEKAWHLASVLLSIGRPCSSVELSQKCSLCRTSPEFVEFLCSFPNSPLFLTPNNFVLLSMVAYKAVGALFASSLPMLQIQAPEESRLNCGKLMVKTYSRKRKKLEHQVMQPSVKKRAIWSSVDGIECERTFFSAERIISSCFERVNQQTAYLSRALNSLPFGISIKPVNLGIFSDIVAMTPSSANSNIHLLEYQLTNDEGQGSGKKQNTPLTGDMQRCIIMEEYQDKCHTDKGTNFDMPDLDRERTKAPLLESFVDISAMLEEFRFSRTNFVSRMDTAAPSYTELDQHNKNTSVEVPAVASASENVIESRVPEIRMEDLAKQPLSEYSAPKEGADKISFGYISSGKKICQTNMECFNGGIPSLEKEPLNVQAQSQQLLRTDLKSVTHKSGTKISASMKNAPRDELTQKQKMQSRLLPHNKADSVYKVCKSQKDRNTIDMKDKPKQNARKSAFIQDKCDNLKSSKDQQEPKSFPEFECYSVEEEEGSGGYGTVYRARRKSDGITFAIKYPHANAHKHHVKNELKMLERFGGRNFVIKYESSFKSGKSECFVLEHVEHDRPELLKREISIFQLQWYGYCMFRALTSLHKQGVFHRDVKPGNFLFSSKTNKGYLIDFNLAKDLHQKHGNLDKGQPSYVRSIHHIPVPQSKSVSPNKRRKLLGGKSSEAFKAGTASGSKQTLESKTLKKKTLDKLKAYDDLGRLTSVNSQGAEGSGLTSAKDITSTRSPSLERLKEPLPCQGRKELINLAQEAMQNPNLAAASTPTSKRKRVVASPGIVDRKLIFLTPMPLHSSGMAISGAGSLKSRGEVKTHKEGPCVGTKGFRAPEVLLRSVHQGPKIDVWSAGVTLLYLMTGRLPFTGDPEQNMKDIVKLKGNEELWEVAKLHNCESSFPVELLDIRFLPSVKIKDWCVVNTKRPEFMEAIPESLFDLIDKCLTVNPRSRITAEEALNHEFFAPCHEALQRQRLLRRGPNNDSKTPL